MNILFVFSNLEPNCGANVNIGMTLAKCMSKNHKVDVVAGRESLEIDAEKTSIFGRVYQVEKNEDDLLNDFLNGFDWKQKNAVQKIIQLLAHPKYMLLYLDVANNLYLIRGKFFRETIESACKAKTYDAVVGIVFPYSIALAISKANVTLSKKFIVMLDPFYSNHVIIKPNKRIRKMLEKSVGKRVDKIFTTDLIIKDAPYKKSELYKMMDFPEIIVGKRQNSYVYSGADAVNFTYVGSFYEDIRNPKYLLELFDHLPEKYVLNIVGGGCDSLLDSYKSRLGDRLRLYGVVSSDEAKRMRDEADVLINVNNTLSNQIPSKLFEYIETGKPILNICKKSDCPSLNYIYKYENAINVHETEYFDDVRNRIVEFLDGHLGTIISHDTIEKTFVTNTDQYVADQILMEICHAE